MQRKVGGLAKTLINFTRGRERFDQMLGNQATSHYNIDTIHDRVKAEKKRSSKRLSSMQYICLSR